MLIGFSAGNYKSFKETVTLSMVASSITEEDKELDENNVFVIDRKLKLLKSAAIYGANASGKSNLVAAISFMKWFVLNSSKETQVSEAIDIEAFRLSTETEKEPSFFEIVFLLEGKNFRYGFEVNAEQVVSEWLFQTDDRAEKMLFERDFDNFILDDFPEGQGISDKTRSNALFISVVAQFNGKLSGKILLWFSKTLQLISGLQDRQYRKETLESFENDRHRHDIIEFIKKLDLGIADIEITNQPVFIISNNTALYGNSYGSLYPISESKPTVKTVHRKYDADGKQTAIEIFDIEKHESEGTNKLFALAGLLLDTLRIGKILFIDELDARLHPLITRELICLFNSNETNPHNAQLIFTTHDTNLLSSKTFRKDQVWFTEKDNKGATDLYSLVEYKVGKDASFEDDYIIGKYGAIPFIGNFKELIG
ncbi:MAG: ATP-binding protein [Microcoleus sp. PH2017_10_PVI_O_A]|uniref:AAA family ATPase n=1 Tax=unclassified Microcoleus TaxID=2642155 RepID=UPI001E10374F|nr:MULTISPECIES: ATP-binding protein [unclassified Microcoleus]TAE80943.1 MAG: ATP-binding protein [Oscillatoriales cyanobacterium]MCC3407348.1 ATP-binding protein [Microcoleus sp. PH2017_10_PVI_O_A]MCC3461416.1 ATP-binding protein [Microcoleus sp. PH2017_11_PCY_U_A]MCC3479891.1 ATP-binding protein [Microcoleus sp. PH2017_12_PCY_D_A]MCC3560819.1 ATP-binding protein [Microcoleus sp. PH2017_27_LUM_O_A]